ncbi:hypothetical protein C7999DRAFT_39889 [Corynascus novoguineensis]|uniref:Arginase n=1 Tax=Corynascus novoguineensis TaxID=1126955 RepID=A0AAN7CXD5_9PEZI|nr:hypothetical protein C7999DRAFT_39889 [Corynascus novoguineensis]
MSSRVLKSITVISVPYHVGLRASPMHRSRISEGPDYIKHSGGLLSVLRDRGLPVHEIEIPPAQAPEFEGEISRTFELIRRVSRAVTAARDSASFPIVLAGNCCTSVGVASGLLGSEDLRNAPADALGCAWFDAHDDYNVPDTMVSGYFDGQGIAMMAGECWRALVASVPGFRPLALRRVVHCGMRDVNELERARVEGSDMGVVWGGVGDEATSGKVDFAAGMRKELAARFKEGDDSAMLVHLDVDVIDPSVGKASAFEFPGGLFEEDLTGCMAAISEKTVPVAFTIASFDPLYDGDESAKRLAALSIKGVGVVLDGLEKRGLLQTSKQ